jgi:hypothetical protein
MGGTTRVVIINENEEPLSFVTWTGSENEFFFSEKFIKGQIAEGIKEMLETAQQFSTPEAFTLSPEGYGLSVIDFKNKKLFIKTDYDSPSRLSLTSYSLRLDGTYNYAQEKFLNLTQNNQLQIVNAITKKIFSLNDFFGTMDVKEIIELLQNVDKRKTIPSVINPNTSSENLFEYYINPINFDFQYQQYDNTFELFKALYSQNYPINEKDIDAWDEYINIREEEESEEKIKDFATSFKEQNYLNSTLNNKTKLNQKIKL